MKLFRIDWQIYTCRRTRHVIVALFRLVHDFSASGTETILRTASDAPASIVPSKFNKPGHYSSGARLP